MSEVCRHEGWGTLGYSGETGPCPPPAQMREIDGGKECPVCEFHIRYVPMSAVFRETATLARETR